MELVPASDYWDIIAKSRESPILALVYRLPPRLWREISWVQSELRLIDGRQLFANPETFHITVKGLGVISEETSEQELASLISETQKIVSNFSSFNIRLKGLNYFPTVIYANVIDETGELQKINKKIIEELGDSVEKSKYDGDDYIPHLTIATFNSKEAQELISEIDSPRLREKDFGIAHIFELELVEARMYLLLGPKDVQPRGLKHLRTIELRK